MHTFSMAADAVLGSDSLEPNELGYKYIYKEQVLHMYSVDTPRGTQDPTKHKTDTNFLRVEAYDR